LQGADRPPTVRAFSFACSDAMVARERSMKLYVRDGKLQAGSFFKFVFVGVLIGEGLIFGIPFLFITIAMLTIAATGTPIAGNAPQMVWLLPIMFPMIVAMHAVMFGGMIVLGLWIYSRFGKLEITEES
jgi:hypothetical protein